MTSLETIKKLREKTGASLQACKKALEESHGDESIAIDILRKKGEAKAASREDRETTEGVVAAALMDGKATLLQLGCETDFVAKNPDFLGAAKTFAEGYLSEGESYDPSKELGDLTLKMAEKIVVADHRTLEGEVVGSYVHSNQKIGAIVALQGGDEEMARDIAMHITAMKPMVLSPDEVDGAKVEKEREIWMDQLKKEGKPEAIVLKIMEGKEKKFREENALLKQPFVKNPDQTIEQLLNGVQIKGFMRLGN